MSPVPPEGPTVPDHLPLALRVEFEADAYRRVRQAPVLPGERRSRLARVIGHRMTPVVGAALLLTVATVWALVSPTPTAVMVAVLCWSLGVAGAVAIVSFRRLAPRLGIDAHDRSARDR